ncbi:MAG: hypothetical protein H0W77_16960 [Acidobacteria bacterium]|nr:hypothetical protein [Acidobacteriota bacterium]
MNVKETTNKNFEEKKIKISQSDLQVQMNLKEFGKFSVRSRELGVNKNLDYDNIGELVEQIEKIQK